MPKTTEKNIKEALKEAVPSGKYYYANGKRKCAIARVRLYKGTGTITINEKSAQEYFPVKVLLGLIKTPLKLINAEKEFDIVATVQGGGVIAQADALRHGIAKALVEIDATNKTTLKKAKLITRDSRVKERKKFGLKRARKAPQFSKR